MEWLERSFNVLKHFFADDPIVLVDVGASGMPPERWRFLAPFACYLGFDPDLRELRKDNSYGFQRFLMMNHAVTDLNTGSVDFYLTKSPYCSSFLRPDISRVNLYSFSDLFSVQSTTTATGVKLDEALINAQLKRMDWLKLDTQGKDLDIYLSVEPSVRNSILVLDIEPGVIPFYEGENTFSPANATILNDHYWLSNITAQRFPRISRETREEFKAKGVDFDRLPGNPTAFEATYFRELSQLDSRHASARDYVCFWTFAMLEKSFGAALDAIATMITNKIDSTVTDILAKETIREIELMSQPQKQSSARAIAKSILPPILLPVARKILSAIRKR